MIRSALAQFQKERKKVISINFQWNALNIAKTTYFFINSSTKGHYIGRQGVIGGAEFYKTGQMRMKRRGCAFHSVKIFHTSWKFSLYFVHIFRTDWNILTKLCSSDPSFIWTILTLLYLNLKHLRMRELQLFITTYYYYKFLTWYEFETYIRETFLINEVGQQCFFQLDHVTFF